LTSAGGVGGAGRVRIFWPSGDNAPPGGVVYQTFKTLTHAGNI
jgi:hypothetical protein